jgi:hypothetical protein
MVRKGFRAASIRALVSRVVVVEEEVEDNDDDGGGGGKRTFDGRNEKLNG